MTASGTRLIGRYGFLKKVSENLSQQQNWPNRTLCYSDQTLTWRCPDVEQSTIPYTVCRWISTWMFRIFRRKSYSAHQTAENQVSVLPPWIYFGLPAEGTDGSEPSIREQADFPQVHSPSNLLSEMRERVRNFGANTIWYLQFHRVCDKLSVLSFGIVWPLGLLWALTGSLSLMYSKRFFCATWIWSFFGYLPAKPVVFLT